MSKKSKKPRTVKDDPKVIFQSGEMYRAASAVLGQPRFSPRFIAPACALAAFSLELYFKSLIVLDNRVPPENHDLQRLFSLLSKDHQQNIRHFFKQENAKLELQFRAAEKLVGRPIPRPNFDQILDLSKSAFVKLRYAYQTDSLRQGEGWTAQVIWDGTRTLILKLHPDWAVPLLGSSPTSPVR
jgi:hypothetical protein